MVILRISCVAVFLLVAAFGSASSVCGQNAEKRVTAKVQYGGKDYFGLPVGWDGKQVALLSPTGSLDLIPIASKDAVEIVADEFHTYSASDIRRFLQSQYGNRYDVSASKQYVVVHPWGDPSIYVQPFDDFHKRFVSFFSSHEITLNEPPTPLIAIVLRSRNDFNRTLLNEIDLRDSRVSGFYSQKSNRINTYDPQATLREKGDRWLYNAKTIIHEATHQSAFNTGVHNRFAPPPKWLSEGLAMLFETPGFNNAEKFPKPIHRVNEVRLKQFRKLIRQEKVKGSLNKLIAYDHMFEDDAVNAYALSWGLSYFLYERDKEKYVQFLQQDAKRKNFVKYSPDRRLGDFAAAFGNDLNGLEESLIELFEPKRGPRR